MEFLLLVGAPREGGEVIALLAAVREEISGVRRHVAVDASIRGRGWHLCRGQYDGKEVLLVQTGMGRANAQKVTRRVLEDYDVTALVAFGFAGALCRELAVGDVVLCRELYSEADPAICYSAQRLLPLAAGVLHGGAIRAQLGSSVTVSRMVTDPEQKKALRSIFRAEAVDMESYWVAKLASARQIPFLAVHAISDTAGERMPPLGRFVSSDGEWLWTQALRFFLARPGQLADLASVFRNTRQAGGSLTGFLDALIPEL